MTTLSTSSRRASSILVALLAIVITTLVLGGMFGFLAFKVRGAVEQRNTEIQQQIDSLG